MLLTVIIIIAIIIIIFCVVPIEALQNNLTNNVEFVANGGLPSVQTEVLSAAINQQTALGDRLMQVLDRYLATRSTQNAGTDPATEDQQVALANRAVQLMDRYLAHENNKESSS